jgi:hypothetical protein
MSPIHRWRTALPKAKDEEVLLFIERNGLWGRGLGLIDIHLLASCLLAKAPLWTKDVRLAKVAKEMELEAHW